MQCWFWSCSCLLMIRMHGFKVLTCFGRLSEEWNTEVWTRTMRRELVRWKWMGQNSTLRSYLVHHMVSEVHSFQRYFFEENGGSRRKQDEFSGMWSGSLLVPIEDRSKRRSCETVSHRSCARKREPQKQDLARKAGCKKLMRYFIPKHWLKTQWAGLNTFTRRKMRVEWRW